MKRIILLSCLFMSAAVSQTLKAEYDANEFAEAGIPPAFYDARFSVVEGDVAIQGVSDVDAIRAVLNHLVTTGDRIMSLEDGRCEVQFEVQQRLRLWHDTKVDLKQLDQTADTFSLDLYLMIGDVDIYTQPKANLAQFTMDLATPAGMIRLLKGCSVRISVDDAGVTTVRVRDGSAEVLGGKRSVIVQRNQAVTIEPGKQVPNPGTWESEGGDEFEAWIWDLNQAMLEGTASTEDVASLAEKELEGNGEWMETPDYGPVWRPYVWHDWCPYYYGSWSWSMRYGYYWVPAEPWGWYPFHYGYWSWIPGYGWVWIPGRYWGPAWVWFYHDYDNVCWIPRHPRDHYRHVRWEGRRPYNAAAPVNAFIAAPLSALQIGSVQFFERRAMDEQIQAMRFTAGSRDIPALKQLIKVQKTDRFRAPEVTDLKRPKWADTIYRSKPAPVKLLNRTRESAEQRSPSSSRPLVIDRQGNRQPPEVIRSESARPSDTRRSSPPAPIIIERPAPRTQREPQPQAPVINPPRSSRPSQQAPAQPPRQPQPVPAQPDKQPQKSVEKPAPATQPAQAGIEQPPVSENKKVDERLNR